MLSQTAEHALRALLFLACTNGDTPASAARIARAIGAPHRYLAKVLATLAGAGLVSAARGRDGGYRLTVTPASIVVSDLMDLFPSNSRNARCLLGDRDCDASDPCPAHSLWGDAQEKALAHFRTLRISDLASPRRLAGAGHPQPIRAMTRKHILTALAVVVAAVAFIGAIGASPASLDDKIGVPDLPALKGMEVATLTSPPLVPPPIERNHATVVQVELEVVEKVMKLANGVEYEFWTFGGTVPGSFIRVREGDLVEFTLKNHHDSKFPHNIDLHAVTGQGGGAEASFVVPGKDKTFAFRALNPGLYVYHCATPPVPIHIANGMYGLILVEPKDGLPEVDHEFYVMQGDFYTKGRHGEPGLQDLDFDKLYDEQPDYIVFNGAVGAMTGDNAPEVGAGETVRLFVGNGGPNLTSNFHAIGEIFDVVRVEGGSLINRNVQTTLIPAGGATIVEFRADVPSTLLLVDHAISRVFNKGAVAAIRVTGDEQPQIFREGAVATNVADR